MDRPIHCDTLFDLTQAGHDPFALFAEWYDAALKEDPHNAGVMNLATMSDNQPSARMVLLKKHGSDGLVFYTHYLSRKGHELDANPQAALTFWWPGPERQIRMAGRIEKISPEGSDTYFASRPRDSQLGAYISAQSSVIENPLTLCVAEEKFKGKEIPRPNDWGGYLLIPERFEFWQGRTSRLHDRIVFELTDTNWKRFRLAP